MRAIHRFTAPARRYYGTKYNDAYSVTVRGVRSGARSEARSLNAFAFTDFAPDKGVQWGTLQVPVASGEEGDTVQVDLMVANVGDGCAPCVTAGCANPGMRTGAGRRVGAWGLCCDGGARFGRRRPHSAAHHG